MTILGHHWFAAFYVYVQHDFIASIIASFLITPARLLRQPRMRGHTPSRHSHLHLPHKLAMTARWPFIRKKKERP
jgi:hypothetical protein